MSNQAQLQIEEDWGWTNSLAPIGSPDRGASSPDTFTPTTEYGTDTAVAINGTLDAGSLPDDGVLSGTWDMSPTTQHFVIAATAPNYGDSVGTGPLGFAVIDLLEDFQDYVTNTSASAVTVKVTYTLDSSFTEGDLLEATMDYDVGPQFTTDPQTGGYDFRDTGGTGTATYDFTIAAGGTVLWDSQYSFEGESHWYLPGGAVTPGGSPFAFDASDTGITSADELDSLGNPVAGNPDLTFQSGINFSSLACFVKGTRIAVPDGTIEVERLTVGDCVTSVFGGSAPVIWLGRRVVDCRRHPDPSKLWPVRVSAGAFGPAMPRRDLWLSLDHAIFTGSDTEAGSADVLIPIRHLINGTTIKQVPMDEVTYFHVELPRHGVLLAEGLPCESYLDTGNRSNFANGGEVTLHADFSPLKWEVESCAPLIVIGPKLDAVRNLVSTHARPAMAIPENRRLLHA
jgi:hypothetical protein